MGNCLAIENSLHLNFKLVNRGTSKKNMSGNEVKAQLHVYHNPFAGVTSQPKIPDGKATHSLGFSTQSVNEISNGPGGAGSNVIHMLLYPGMNSALVCGNAEQNSVPARGYFIPQFLRSGAADWIPISGSPEGPVEIKNSEGYAKWRVVSCGVQLKLLNSVEEDDGWWEACRINEAIDNAHYRLTTTGNGGTGDIAQQGTLAPVELAGDLSARQIANEPTYMTGLLRDLNKVQFECHPVADEHDFKVMRDPLTLAFDEWFFNNVRIEGALTQGTANTSDLIQNFVDQSHDMVYIRLHCRPKTENSSGSRFHVNVVSNQEIIYDTNDRLARYVTRAHNVGDGNMGAHANLRRGMAGAANMVN